MRAVVGLGNPGKEYQDTPHNAGFAVVDDLASRWGCSLRRSSRFNARMGRTEVAGDAVLLVMPETFMNLCGSAVAAVLGYWKLGPEQLIVAVDDADLPVGALRLRARGGSGGHRGLLSVIESVGSDAFPRVRIGIGRGEGDRSLKAYVLSALPRSEVEIFRGQIRRGADAVQAILEHGVDWAMNRFNATSAPAEQEKDGSEAN